MLDPLLRMLVELICDVLFRDPGFYVLVLHFFDYLEGVVGDGVEGT